MKTGIEIITEERERQISVEGYSLENDQKHEEGELANAAALYALSPEMMDLLDHEWGHDMYLHFWPFDLKLLKKDMNGNLPDRVRELAKAGALIAAEIDRLQNF